MHGRQKSLFGFHLISFLPRADLICFFMFLLTGTINSTVKQSR